MTYAMNQRGMGMWYPNERDNASAKGLFQNLASGRVPQHKVPSQLCVLMKLNPYADEHKNYLLRTLGTAAEAQAIITYFDLD